jgi:hypothetical protein
LHLKIVPIQRKKVVFILVLPKAILCKFYKLKTQLWIRIRRLVSWVRPAEINEARRDRFLKSEGWNNATSISSETRCYKSAVKLRHIFLICHKNCDGIVRWCVMYKRCFLPFKKLPTHTLAGFDLKTHSSAGRKTACFTS